MKRCISASAIGVAALFAVGVGTSAAAGRGGHAAGFGSPHWGTAQRHCAGMGCRPFAHLAFRRIPYAAFANGAWYYGSYDDLGSVDDSGVSSVNVVPVPMPAAATIRSNCHMQTKSYVVPAEAGGEKKVAVTRCVSDAAFASGAADVR